MMLRPLLGTPPAFLERALKVGAGSRQRRRQPKEQCREPCQRQSKRENRQIHADGVDAGNIRRHARHHSPQNSEGQKEAQPGSRQSQQQIFRRQLAKQTRAPSAQRQPYGDFPLAVRRTAQEKVGDIGAGDEQDKAHSAQQQEQECSDLAHHLAAERQSHGAKLYPVAELRRVSLEDSISNRFDVGVGAGQANAGLQSRQDAVIEIVTFIGQFLAREGHGNEDVRRVALLHALEGEGKASRHDADHRIGLAVQRHRPPDDPGVRTEAPLPQRVSQDGDRVPGLIFVGRKRASEHWLYAQQRKQAGVDTLGGDALGLAFSREVELPAAESGN